MTHTLENQHLRVCIREQGAELDSILHKNHQIEYLWQADPAHWAKKSPVLFPIVGALKDGTYFHNGQARRLPRHGFARERAFVLAEQTANSLFFAQNANDETRKVYPFEFRFGIRYQLSENTLSVTYEVENPASEVLYFSVGGHPAFNVPLVPGTRYEDYLLTFDKPEKLLRWPLTPGGLIGDASGRREVPAQSGVATVLPLSKQLFSEDALVFKHLASTRVRLSSEKTPHGLEMTFEGSPYFGVWAAKNADFVCLEPWCGIADAEDTNQQLAEKEGIVFLQPNSDWHRGWQVAFW